MKYSLHNSSSVNHKNPKEVRLEMKRNPDMRKAISYQIGDNYWSRLTQEEKRQIGEYYHWLQNQISGNENSKECPAPYLNNGMSIAMTVTALYTLGSIFSGLHDGKDHDKKIPDLANFDYNALSSTAIQATLFDIVHQQVIGSEKSGRLIYAGFGADSSSFLDDLSEKAAYLFGGEKQTRYKIVKSNFPDLSPDELWKLLSKADGIHSINDGSASLESDLNNPGVADGAVTYSEIDKILENDTALEKLPLYPDSSKNKPLRLSQKAKSVFNAFRYFRGNPLPTWLEIEDTSTGKTYKIYPSMAPREIGGQVDDPVDKVSMASCNAVVSITENDLKAISPKDGNSNDFSVLDLILNYPTSRYCANGKCVTKYEYDLGGVMTDISDISFSKDYKIKLD
jgi:hypothetical protein